MKKRIRKTGEIVDVIAWYNMLGAERDRGDSVSYIDSKGNECVKVEGLNLSWDFEDVEEVPDIYWEHSRYDIAKSALQGFCANSDLAIAQETTFNQLAAWSIEIADILIAELRKGGEK